MNGSRKAGEKFGILLAMIAATPITGYLLMLALGIVAIFIQPFEDLLDFLGVGLAFIICSVITGTVLLCMYIKLLSDDKKSDAKARAQAILEKESPSMDFVLDPKTENRGTEKITERANQILTKWSVLNTSNLNEVVSRYQKCNTLEMDLQKQIISFEQDIERITESLN